MIYNRQTILDIFGQRNAKTLFSVTWRENIELCTGRRVFLPSGNQLKLRGCMLEMDVCKQDIFLRQKEQCLRAVDLSRKGSIDEPIVELVDYINTKADFFTTSSCSGRICVHEDASC